MGFLSSLFGIKGSQPKTSTVVQAQKLPEEISPFVKEILGEAQDLYKKEAVQLETIADKGISEAESDIMNIMGEWSNILT